MSSIELRIHGVSGTPPEDMLYTGPVTYDLSSRAAKVYEVEKDPWDVRAFHWGSLTAGKWYTAFWILLAPFALANSAGWMIDRKTAFTRAFGRLSGLALTGLMFAQVARALVDIPYREMAQRSSNPAAWMFWIFVAVSSLLVLGLGYFSTQSTFGRLSIRERVFLVFSPNPKHMSPPEFWDSGVPKSQWDDPAHEAVLTDSAMWSTHAMVHRLRRLHLAGGMVVLSLAGTSGLPKSENLRTTVIVTGVVLAALILTTTWFPNSIVFARWPTAVSTLLTTVLVGLTASAILSNTPSSGTGVSETGDLFAQSGHLAFVMVLVLAASAGLAVLGQSMAGTFGNFWRAGWASLGILVVGALIGAALGITAALMTETFLSNEAASVSEPEQWAALAMLILILSLAVGFLLFFMFPLTMMRPLDRRATATDDELNSSHESASESVIRRSVLRTRFLLSYAGLFGLAAAIFVAIQTCEPWACDANKLNLPSGRFVWDWKLELSGLTFDMSTLVGFALLLAVAGPALLILWSIIRGLSSGQESRRQVGILWDLGSFWPRWHHPLAPPAYAPNAISRLEEEIDNRNPMVLAAHSQGSVISAVAIYKIATRDLSKQAKENKRLPGLFLTYGSQLGILYPLLFPTVGFDDLVKKVDEEMHERWINLWRRSDQIGGQYIPQLGIRNWHISTGAGHSQYELTPEYCVARNRVFSFEIAELDDTELIDCWESD